MNSFFISLIRTATPIVVGYLATQLLRLGVEIDVATTAGTLQAVFAGVYYAGARYLEGKFPVLGYLLGHPGAPSYTAAPTPQ